METPDEITADKIIDSRDIIARLEHLTDERAALSDAVDEARETLKDAQDDTAADGLADEAEEALDAATDALAEWNDDHAEELAALKSCADDCEGYGDWAYGETLIREDHFEDYARELAVEIGAIPRYAKWPLTCIDWGQAADELRQDYTETELFGHTYLMHS
jgi:hypothetical protein